MGYGVLACKRRCEGCETRVSIGALEVEARHLLKDPKP